MEQRFSETRHLIGVLSIKPRLMILTILADGPAKLEAIATRLKRSSARVQKHLEVMIAERLVMMYEDRYSLTDRVNLASTPERHIFDIATDDGGLTLGLKPRC
jgi:predicted transcriptional regulator